MSYLSFFLLAWGSVWAQDTQSASATVNLSLNLVSATQVTMEIDRETGTMLVTGLTVGTDDARIVTVSIEDPSKLEAVAFLGNGLDLKLRTPIDTAIALTAK